MPKPQNIYGFQIRNPYPSEIEYFKNNPNVSGMATEDNAIILNPHSNLNEYEMGRVAENEAIRLWLRKNNIMPDFQLTSEQVRAFKGSPYEGNELELKHSIISRILTGDPSARNTTPEQNDWASFIKYMLNK